MRHDLKTWPKDFEAVRNHVKTHEARKADRLFAVGDTLRLREWVPTSGKPCDWQQHGLIGSYTGRWVDVYVTHLTLGEYGLPPDLAIMSIEYVTHGLDDSAPSPPSPTALPR